MKRFHQQPALHIGLIIFCALSSCVSPGLKQAQSGAQQAIAKRGGTPAEQEKFAKDQKKTMLQGTGLGAVLGAGAGYALGGARGALAGAVLGGLIGNRGGQHVAMKKALAQTSEANLDACISEAGSENAATKRWIAALNHKLVDYKKRAATARALNDRKELARIDRELKALDKQVAGEVKDYAANVELQRQLIAKLPSSHSMFARLNRTLNQSVECHDLLAAADILGASRSMPYDPPQPKAADRQDVPDPDALKNGDMNKLQEVPDPDALKRGRRL